MEFVLKTTSERSMRMIFVAGIGASLLLSVVLSAQETGSKSEASTAVSDLSNRAVGEKKNAKAEVTQADRDASLEFASEHHPELARLLEQLEKSRPQEFARAVRELSQQIQVLERSREKNPARYQAQLQVWKQDSQIRVLMARWSYNHDPKLEKQIRDLLKQRQEVRSSQLKAEKVRLAEQQRRIDEQLATMMQPVEERVDQEWELLSKKARSRKPVSRKNSELPSSAAKK
jgi:hypothetical protein